jgi:hypothetical protein
MLQGIRPYLTRRVILGAVIFAAILFLITLTYTWSTRPEQPVEADGTAIIAVIPAPSPTLSPVPTPAITQTPTQDIPPSPIPGTIGVGAFVQIAGTGGDGLRLRTGPGLENEVGFLGLESEVFSVVDGPEESDGYTWWLLEAPYDEGQKRRGWAVSNYLQSIQNP